MDLDKCKHVSLRETSSRHAATAGYKVPTPAEKASAMQVPGTPAPVVPPGQFSPWTFPAPLVLPGDELSLDPRYPQQSVADCIDCRNVVTPARRTVYVIPPPTIENAVAHVQDWTKPSAKSSIPLPATEDVLAYLQAFYHGLPVKSWDRPTLTFSKWSEKISSTKNGRSYVALGDQETALRIRARPCPDELYPAQLNLNDMLDVAISVLPQDAYALIMLVNHDLYEDEEDDFCCGRAYGGSRVCLVSTARYNPSADVAQEVERVHVWPASHCDRFLEEHCSETDDTDNNRVKVSAKKGSRKTGQQGSALEAAVSAFTALRRPSRSQELSQLWLGRVCKTASHELGHCFGMDHCVFYACIMQGTTGLSEDTGQPPYLCPVDLVKVLTATGGDSFERYSALKRFCETFPKDKMFAAFGAWLTIRMKEVDDTAKE